MAIGSRASRRPASPAPGVSRASASGGSRSTSSATASSCPAFVLIACLVAYPFGMAIYFSLSDYWVGSPGSFVGLGNFREIVGNEVFRQTVWNSFVFTAIALVVQGGPRRVAGAAAGAESQGQAPAPRRRAPAVGDSHRAVHARLVVDVRFALQRGELDGHPPGADQRAGAELAGHVDLRDGRGHHRERVARAALLRHHRPGRARLDPARVLRGGRGGRRLVVRAASGTSRCRCSSRCWRW